MIEQKFGWRRDDTSAAPYTWSEEKRKAAPSRRPVLKAVFPPAVAPTAPSRGVKREIDIPVRGNTYDYWYRKVV
jgi:hypothetical protein